MINIESKMFAAPYAAVRDGFIARARLEAGRIADARQWMLDKGFEIVAAHHDQLITADGREILNAYGKSWALRPDTHAARLAEELAAADTELAEKAKPAAAEARQEPVAEH